MKNWFFNFIYLFLGIFMISCGTKKEDPVILKDQGVTLTHEEYYTLLKSSAKSEVVSELIAKAAKADALELLISEGWRPKDCCCSTKKSEQLNYSYVKPYKKNKDVARGSVESVQKETESFKIPEAPYQRSSQFRFPWITNNAPVFNNYCCGSSTEVKKENTQLAKIESEKEQILIKVDTLIKKVLPWEIELGAGFSKGPVGSLRFGNNRSEMGGIFLWNKENKTANSLVDFVLKPKDGMGLRYGVFYHNEVSPQKWNIPNQKTTSVSAGGVTTVLNSTSNVEVEQWNVSKQTIGPVFGLQGGDEKFFLSTDVMPSLTISKNSPGVDDFTVNARVFGGYYVSPKALLGLNVGLINRELYPTLSLRFIPSLEKTIDK